MCLHDQEGKVRLGITLHHFPIAASRSIATGGCAWRGHDHSATWTLRGRAVGDSTPGTNTCASHLRHMSLGSLQGFSGAQLVQMWVVMCGVMMLMMWSEVVLWVNYRVDSMILTFSFIIYWYVCVCGVFM